MRNEQGKVLGILREELVKNASAVGESLSCESGCFESFRKVSLICLMLSRLAKIPRKY